MGSLTWKVGGLDVWWGLEQDRQNGLLVAEHTPSNKLGVSAIEASFETRKKAVLKVRRFGVWQTSLILVASLFTLIASLLVRN